jgi:hypothetical protein
MPMAKLLAPSATAKPGDEYACGQRIHRLACERVVEHEPERTAGGPGTRRRLRPFGRTRLIFAIGIQLLQFSLACWLNNAREHCKVSAH